MFGRRAAGDGCGGGGLGRAEGGRGDRQVAGTSFELHPPPCSLHVRRCNLSSCSGGGDFQPLDRDPDYKAEPVGGRAAAAGLLPLLLSHLLFSSLLFSSLCVSAIIFSSSPLIFSSPPLLLSLSLLSALSNLLCPIFSALCSVGSPLRISPAAGPARAVSLQSSLLSAPLLISLSSSTRLLLSLLLSHLLFSSLLFSSLCISAYFPLASSPLLSSYLLISALCSLLSALCSLFISSPTPIV